MPIESWTEKYKPTNIDDMVLDEELRTKLKNFMAKGTIPSISLAGVQGIGKSVLSRILADAVSDEILFIPASIKNGVDVVKTKIKEFVDTVSMEGKLKIVILDEADALTKDVNGAGAQDSLRNVIDSSMDDTRFICTCNYVNKIIAPIRSRCTPLNVTFSLKDVAKRLTFILDSEEISYDNDSLREFLLLTQKKLFPDIRATIAHLEMCSITGTLTVSESVDESKAEDSADKVVEMIKLKDSLFNIRKFLIQNAGTFNDDWEALAGKVFNVYSKLEYDGTIGEKLRIVADFIMRINAVDINKDIQFAAMLQRLL